MQPCHAPLTSLSLCPGLSCQNRGRRWCPHPSDEERDPLVLSAQPLRAGAQPLAQGMAAGGSRASCGPVHLGRGSCMPGASPRPRPPQLTACRPAQGPPSPAGSLPRNLAATLQDIETKRQLALQQKGKLRLRALALRGGGTLGDASPAATQAMEKGAWPRAVAAVLWWDAVPLSRSLASPPPAFLPPDPSPDGVSPAEPLPAEPLQPGDLPGRDVGRLGLPRAARRQQHGCLLAPSATRRRGMASPVPRVPLGIHLGTTLRVPNPLMLCPACCQPGACAPRACLGPLLLPGQMLLAMLAREL